MPLVAAASLHSVCQIDELGRSTSSLDGVGICWSASEELTHRSGCYTLLVTHFLELCQLSALYPTVRNLHLRLDVDAAVAGGRPRTNFKVRDGGISVMQGESAQYGIATAHAAGFPDSLLGEARATQSQLRQLVNAQRPNVNRNAQLTEVEGAALVHSTLLRSTPTPTPTPTRGLSSAASGSTPRSTPARRSFERLRQAFATSLSNALDRPHITPDAFLPSLLAAARSWRHEVEAAAQHAAASRSSTATPVSDRNQQSESNGSGDSNGSSNGSNHAAEKSARHDNGSTISNGAAAEVSNGRALA